MWKVQTVGYCGMLIPHDDYDSFKDATDRAKRRIHWLKTQAGCTITKLSPKEWEVQEPEDSSLIPDYCGYLQIVKG